MCRNIKARTQTKFSAGHILDIMSPTCSIIITRSSSPSGHTCCGGSSSFLTIKKLLLNDQTLLTNLTSVGKSHHKRNILQPATISTTYGCQDFLNTLNMKLSIVDSTKQRAVNISLFINNMIDYISSFSI